ncbi:MAG: hypothetical protein QF704_05815 [Anaerolineales bacterium]|nr:hypothetical protein [Anaerolineales bacterium]
MINLNNIASVAGEAMSWSGSHAIITFIMAHFAHILFVGVHFGWTICSANPFSWIQVFFTLNTVVSNIGAYITVVIALFTDAVDIDVAVRAF